MEGMILELRDKLFRSVERNKSDGILFSGGLDSAILAGIDPDVRAVTISLEGQGEDVKYAAETAGFLGLEHHLIKVDASEAIAAVPEVIKVLRSFDPALPNDIVAYFGIKQARDIGIERMMTGDGSDELFAGYSFMREMDDLEEYIRRISSSMRFSSNELGDFLDVDIKQPYLDQDVVDISLGMGRDIKIKMENDKVFGKWILRKAFEGILPEDVIWQSKRPLEYGSGMTGIRDIITLKVSDEEFEEAEKAEGISFFNKEHYYYYKIYRDVVGDIPLPERDEKACPACGAGMKPVAFHCKVCGHVLNWRI
ncbi:MAG: asparagine synthase C-terminal domain-containing protein [Candidatus Aadella gelida]|nr:asparagine synthase C-terminal domain-containing protein [Candidatus Aadella gelida]